MLLCLSIAAASAATLASVYGRIKPSIVYIVVATPSGAQSGTGFIYDSNSTESIIVTAAHVVAGSQRIDVVLDSNPMKRFPATVTTVDRKRDVAYLRIAVGKRASLRLADRPDIAEGLSIAVIGYPRSSRQFERIEGDSLRPTVHSGIISAVRLGGEIIQFDAETDHGDSGGPVIDTTTGKVVAIVRGVMLDHEYASLGLEKPLPGSSYGASAPAIYAALNGLPNGSAMASATSASAASSSESSAYRVAFAEQSEMNPVAQGIAGTFTQRLREHFTGTSEFYAIPASQLAYSADGSKIQQYCDDARVNAVVLPIFRWYADGSMYGNATVQIGVMVSDCYGVPFYVASKTKSESRAFSNRTQVREIIDMGNDLIDQILQSFDAMRETQRTKWTNLLRNGIAIDPKSEQLPALVGVFVEDHRYRVRYIRPEGRAAKAGMRIGDVIEAVDDNPVNPRLTAFEVSGLLDNARTVTVKRPDGEVRLIL